MKGRKAILALAVGATSKEMLLKHEHAAPLTSSSSGLENAEAEKPNPSPRLPPELFEIIIDYLHDFPEALSAVSCVSHAFVPIARRHLFRAFRISWPKRSFSAFAEFVQNASLQVRTSIEELTFHSSVLSPSMDPKLWNARSRVTTALLSSILPSLPNLRMLTLDLVTIEATPLPPGEERYFQPRIGRLRFLHAWGQQTGLTDYLSILSIFRSIDNLEISQIWPPTAALDDVPISRLIAGPELPSELRVRNFALFVNAPLYTEAWLEVLQRTRSTQRNQTTIEPSLESLYVLCENARQTIALGDFLRASGAFLTHLKFNIAASLVFEVLSGRMPLDTFVQHLALRSSCPRLHTLTLCLDISDIEELRSDLFSCITALQHAAPRALSTLVLEIDLGFNFEYEAEFVIDGMDVELMHLEDAVRQAKVEEVQFVWRCPASEGGNRMKEVKELDARLHRRLSELLTSPGVRLVSRWSMY